MSKRSKADVKYAIDLLWTHQVRRENAFLHQEIERLREDVNTSLNNVDTTRQSALAAQNSAEQFHSAIGRTEHIQHDLAATVNDAAKRIEDVARQSSLLEPKIEEIRKNGERSVRVLALTVQQVESAIQASGELQQQRLSSIREQIADFEQQLVNKAETTTVQTLVSRVDEVQESLKKAQESEPSPGVVIDSIEEATGQHGGDYHHPSLRRCATDLIRAPETDFAGHQATLPACLRSSARKIAPPPLNRRYNLKDSLTEEEMLTLQPKDAARMSVVSEDLDLDENVTTMSYARGMNTSKDVNAEDSLPMLPVQQSVLPVTFSEVMGLKQGRFHSWDRYFAEGENLFTRLPREREFSVVKAFLEGLFDVNQRRQCQQWLNLNGWTWGSVASFGCASTPVVGGQHTLTSEATRVPSPAKVHFQEPERSVQRPPERQADNPSKVGGRQSQPFVANQERRKSQRLVELGEASQRLLSLQDKQKQEDQKIEESIITKRSSTKRSAKVYQKTQRNAHASKQTSKTEGIVGYIAAANPPRGKRSPARKAIQSQEKNKVPSTKTSLPGPTRTGPKSRRLDIPLAKESNKVPVSAQKQFLEAPSSPVRQKPPSPFRSIQPTPRLVKRKRATSHGHNESDEEVPLPRVPRKKAVQKPNPPPKKRHLPLPPPPAIPILPTSED